MLGETCEEVRSMAFAESAHAEAVIPVSDEQLARDFYGGTLGFSVLQDEPGMGIWYEAGGGSRFFVYQSVGAGESRATLASFVVDDLETAMEELRGRGVTFEDYDMPGLKTENGVATMGNVRGAWFKDADGNILAVSEPPSD
jgi:catechol 2,3-dioxygenase-like lactoylglutathione lyase family enzyme